MHGFCSFGNGFVVFALHSFFLFIIAFFLLCFSVIAHDGQIIQIITDYECVTCHRIFQSQDVRF